MRRKTKTGAGAARTGRGRQLSVCAEPTPGLERWLFTCGRTRDSRLPSTSRWDSYATPGSPETEGTS